MDDRDLAMDSDPRGTRPDDDPWRDNELARRRRIREDARRPLGVNLAEGIALSEYLATFAGSLRRR